jgi:hypothetical protein
MGECERKVWMNMGYLGGTFRGMEERRVVLGRSSLTWQDLALDLFQNYYKTPFCSL